MNGSIWLADVFDKFDYGQPVQEMVDGHLVVVERPHGIVDGADLGALLARWKTNDPVADIAPVGAPDGIVDGADLGTLLARWKDTANMPSSPPALPEPATMSLLTLAGIGILARRKR